MLRQETLTWRSENGHKVPFPRREFGEGRVDSTSTPGRETNQNDPRVCRTGTPSHKTAFRKHVDAVRHRSGRDQSRRH